MEESIINRKQDDSMAKDKKLMWVGAFLTIVIISLLYFTVIYSSEDGEFVATSEGATATFVINFGEEEDILSEDIEFHEGDTITHLLETHFDAEMDEEGFVHSIEGVENNPDEGLFWVYDLNGEMGLESAEEYEVQEDDLIEWILMGF